LQCSKACSVPAPYNVARAYLKLMLAFGCAPLLRMLSSFQSIRQWQQLQPFACKQTLK